MIKEMFYKCPVCGFKTTRLKTMTEHEKTICTIFLVRAVFRNPPQATSIIIKKEKAKDVPKNYVDGKVFIPIDVCFRVTNEVAMYVNTKDPEEAYNVFMDSLAQYFHESINRVNEWVTDHNERFNTNIKQLEEQK